MSEKPLPFVITDRRKFNSTGEPRPDADPSPEKHRDPVPEAAAPAPAPTPIQELKPTPIAAVPPPPAPEDLEAQSLSEDADLPPAPTPEQMEQSRLAFEATADRLDTAVRAANPGADHPPALSFEGIVQSVYMQAILQLGGGTQEGQQPQVDILGARQSIDMLAILVAKTAGNLSANENLLVTSALFELRLAFLEITQALARSAQQRAPAAPGMPPAPGSKPGPSLIR